MSLFDGIGTGRLALERAGIKIERYYASEIDEKAIQIANTNFQDIVQIGDAEKVNINNLEKIDLLIGGVHAKDLAGTGSIKILMIRGAGYFWYSLKYWKRQGR